MDTGMHTSSRDRLVRTRVPNIVERGWQTVLTSFNICDNKRNVEEEFKSAFNIDLTSIQHVSTRLKEGGDQTVSKRDGLVVI